MSDEHAEVLVDTLANTEAETKAVEIFDKVGDLKCEALVDHLTTKLGEAKAATLCNTLGHVEEQALFHTLSDTDSREKGRETWQHTGQFQGQGTG